MRRPRPLTAEAQQRTLRLAWMPALTAWAPGTSVDTVICSSGSSSWFSWRHWQHIEKQIPLLAHARRQHALDANEGV